MSEATPETLPTPSSHFARIAALAEILFVIALGNVAGLEKESLT